MFVYCILLFASFKEMSIEKLLEKIQVEFTDEKLFREAITHRSYLNENRSYKFNHNERLEFLGDAVLELIITEYLFGKFNNPEGELTSWRAALVNGEMLAQVAQELGVGEHILMSRGEAKDTGRARQYILANALEAIIGAIYLDGGYEVAKKFVLENIAIRIDDILKEKTYLDPKSYFQEKAQEQEKVTPSYRVTDEWGPDHDKHFKIGVFLGEELIAEGEGISKQDAQREAAKAGLEKKGWI